MVGDGLHAQSSRMQLTNHRPDSGQHIFGTSRAGCLESLLYAIQQILTFRVKGFPRHAEIDDPVRLWTGIGVVLANQAILMITPHLTTIA
jgi:hypothetical protein